MQIVTPYLYLVFTEGESHLTINTHRQEKEKGLGKTAVRKGIENWQEGKN
jgi:hypothetical protein